MASLRDFRKRIRSVKSTQKITKAMKMVAAARLRRAQERLMAARPYAQKIGELVRRLSARVDPALHPLLSSPEGAKRVLAVVFASDRGLCGGFNSNILRAAEANIRKWRADGKEISIIAVGRKGRDYFRKRGHLLAASHIQLRDVTFETAVRVAEDVVTEYMKGDVSGVYLVFSHFRSAVSQRPVVDQFLPFSPEERPQDEVEYLYEPSRDALIESLLPRSVRFLIYRALLESYAGQQGAQMTAMDSATNNAMEMIDTLTINMNKARQAAITKELMDIINGAESLRR